MLPVEKYGSMQLIRKEPAVNAEMPKYLSKESSKEVYDFHSSLKQYAPTSLAELSDLAKDLGVKAVCVKDESTRFGLNAFKGLGGSYAVFLIHEKIGINNTINI